MKVTRFKLLTLFVSVLVLGFGIVSLIGADAPVEKNAPSEKPGTLSEWMRLLPKEKWIQVEKVFESNLESLGHSDENAQPDIKVWIDCVYRDMQSILTPGELEGLIGIMNGDTGKRLSAATATVCTNCLAPSLRLGEAYGYLEAAEDDYNSSYCEFGFYPDQVLPLMIAAKIRTGLASAYAEDAYNNCNCTSAQNALYQAREAMWKLGYAITNTTRYKCNPAPWKFWLLMAQSDLDDAISGLSACISETCN